MSLPVIVRLARAEEIGTVMALASATAGAPRWPEVAYREYLAETAEGPQRKAMWVAASGDFVQGFAAAACVADEAELATIAVAASARRSGIGGSLLAAVERWAQRSGAKALLLEVRAGNKGAQALYLARGFQRKGQRARYYSHPVEDAVLMCLPLFKRDAMGGLRSPGSGSGEL